MALARTWQRGNKSCKAFRKIGGMGTLASDKKLVAAVRVLPKDGRPIANLKARAGECRRGRAQLILAGQVNDVVGEVEFHFVNRKVRERDLLRINRVATSPAREHGPTRSRLARMPPPLRGQALPISIERE